MELLWAVVLGVGVFAIAQQLGRLLTKPNRQRLARIEGKLDALLNHARVAYDPLANLPPNVQQAIHDDEYVLAIRRLRETTGLGLQDAKARIDEARLHRST